MKPTTKFIPSGVALLGFVALFCSDSPRAWADVDPPKGPTVLEEPPQLLVPKRARSETDEDHLTPAQMRYEMEHRIGTFLTKEDDAVLLVTDLKYLALVNGFAETSGFLKALVDSASIHGATIIAQVTREQALGIAAQERVVAMTGDQEVQLIQ